MDREEVIRKARKWLESSFREDASGHDYWHVERVRRTALRLAGMENAEPFLTELGAILHDAADHKFHGGDLEAGPMKARELLGEWGADAATVAAAVEIVRGVSFKGAGVETPMSTPEGRCVQDADRLDAIGAIGIGRAFAYGGSRGRAMYDPAEESGPHGSWEAYRDARSSTIAHFHEKLLLLRDRLQTESARKIAEGRHRFMEEFLTRFSREWEGLD